MKKLALVLLSLVLLFLAACSDKDNLTQVSIQELDVPQDFNYNMNSQISVDIQGPYRLPLSITTVDGNLLFRAYLIPEQGINTRLTLPTTVKRVVLHYRGLEKTVAIAQNSLSYDFNVID
jgi:hypothetical protein